MITELQQPRTADSKRAAKFRAMAETLAGQVEQRHAARSTNTPKRQLQATSARIEGDHLERVRVALVKLADAHDRGDCPAALATIKGKAELLGMLKTRVSHPSYYSLVDTGEYHDMREIAIILRQWLEAQKSDHDAAREIERARLAEIERLEMAVRWSDIPGFFPTPAAVIDRMLDAAGDLHGLRVLEPSAGKGDIADAARAAGGSVVCFEVNHTLCGILRAKGHTIDAPCDFLEMQAVAGFDRVLMNPPFERGQDIDHVIRAYSWLAPGGRLVAIMSTGGFQREDRKAQAFRAWLAEVDAIGSVEVSEIPAGAFSGAGAFRATGVACKLVVIDR
jgi:predicted RNA methylase